MSHCVKVAGRSNRKNNPRSITKDIPPPSIHEKTVRKLERGKLFDIFLLERRVKLRQDMKGFAFDWRNGTPFTILHPKEISKRILLPQTERTYLYFATYADFFYSPGTDGLEFTKRFLEFRYIPVVGLVSFPSLLVFLPSPSFILL